MTDLCMCYCWIHNIKQCWETLPVNTAIYIIKLSKYTGDCTLLFEVNDSHRPPDFCLVFAICHAGHTEALILNSLPRDITSVSVSLTHT